MGHWSVNQFAQIVHHQMRAMVPKLLGVPLARDADHQAEVPVQTRPRLPEMASSTTTARVGSTPSSRAAVKNVSGAGLPAKCCAWIMLPSTCTSKKSSNLAAFKTAVAVLTRGDDGDFEPLTAELMDELDASLVRLHPSLFNDFVDQVVLAVPEPAHRFGLAGVVRASLGELDTA